MLRGPLKNTGMWVFKEDLYVILEVRGELCPVVGSSGVEFLLDLKDEKPARRVPSATTALGACIYGYAQRVFDIFIFSSAELTSYKGC